MYKIKDWYFENIFQQFFLLESSLHKGRFLEVQSDEYDWEEKPPSTLQEAMMISRPSGHQVTMKLGTSQKQLWSFRNGELILTGDEFAFGTIRTKAEFYLSELFPFKGNFLFDIQLSNRLFKMKNKIQKLI